MRSNEIFSQMTREEAQGFLETMKDEAPDVAKLALSAAANAFRLRPAFLKRQPRERQAEWMRRALGRTIGAPVAEEILATYFLDHQKDMLVELLDAFGVAHEEGRLEQVEPVCPEDKALAKAVESFRKGDDQERRELLLRAFAAQSSVEWPALDALLSGTPPPAAARAPRPAARKTTAKKATAKKATSKKATGKKAAKKAKAKPKSKAKAKSKAKRKKR
jgi:hypothetical protein